MTMTFKQALGLLDMEVPTHLEAQANVPVLTTPQRQGDLLVWPVDEASVPAHVPAVEDRIVHFDGRDIRLYGPVEQFPRVLVTQAGIQLVRGEATGNTHWLHNEFGSQVTWVPARTRTGAPAISQWVLGFLLVPEGQAALLIHTEVPGHGANGVGQGAYEIRRKREARNGVNGGWSEIHD